MELFYRQYGDTGQAVIILHGLLGMSDNWAHFARKLSERNYRVFLPDARNHGKSPHDEQHSYRYMARDLYELSEKLNIPKAVVIGHSMGGKTAMQYAADYPDRVSKLIVLDIAPRAYSPEEFEQAGRLNHYKLLKILSETNLKRFGSRQQITDYFEQTPEAGELNYFLQKNIESSNAGGYEFKFSPENLLKNMSNIAGQPAFGNRKFTGDVLFVKGEQSNYIVESDFQEIRRLYPNSKHEILQEAGHILHIEKPGELLILLEQFLSQ